MKPLPPRCQCQACGSHHYTDEGTKALNKHHYTCVECGENCSDQFMVRPEVWALTGLAYHDGVLHLRCVEKLINRELVLEDFVDPDKAGMNALLVLVERVLPLVDRKKRMGAQEVVVADD